MSKGKIARKIFADIFVGIITGLALYTEVGGWFIPVTGGFYVTAFWLLVDYIFWSNEVSEVPSSDFIISVAHGFKPFLVHLYYVTVFI